MEEQRPCRQKRRRSYLLQGGPSPAGGTYPVAFTPGAGNYAFGSNKIINASTFSGSRSPLYDYADTLSWTHGTHGFHMGVELRLAVPADTPERSFRPQQAARAEIRLRIEKFALAGLPNQLSERAHERSKHAVSAVGLVNTASIFYWIASQDDVKNGVWQDYTTTRKRDFANRSRTSGTFSSRMTGK